MVMKKRLVCLSFILIFLLAVSATGFCGPKEKVVLQYWAAPLSTNDVVTKVWDKVLVDFEKETGIKVEYEVFPWVDLKKKIMTAMTTGDGPDITGMGNNMSVEFSPVGGLLPITKQRMQKIGGVNLFAKSMTFITGEEGKAPVSIPFTVVTNALFYNKELFKQAGYDQIPDDWSSFIKACQKITKDTNGDGKMDVWGFGLYGKPNESWKPLQMLFFQRGVKGLDGKGYINFNTPEALECVEFLGKFVSDYKITPPAVAEWSGDDAIAAFTNGQLASVIGNSDQAARIDVTKMKDKYGVAHFPYIWPGQKKVFKGGFPSSGHVGGTNIGIMKSTRHETEALKFLAYISRKDISVKLNREFQSISPVANAYDKVQLNEIQKQILDVALHHTQALPLLPYYLPALNASCKNVQNVFAAAGKGELSEATIKREMDTTVAQINASIVSSVKK